MTDSGEASALEGFRRAGIVVWATIGILLLAAAALWLLYQVRAIFPPLVLATALIFFLNPVVSFLERRRVNRTLGTLAIYLVFIGMVVAAALLIVPAVGRQAQELLDDLPEIGDRVTRFAISMAGRVGIDLNEERLTEMATQSREQLLSGIEGIRDVTAGAFHFLLALVLAPIFALYLLIDLPKLEKALLSNLPLRYRTEWLGLLERCTNAVGSFFRGQLVVALIVGVLSSLTLWAVRVPFWLPIGMTAGFFNLIPFVGPFIGALLAVTVGGFTSGFGKALLAGGAMLVVQQVDNHLISPNVMGRAVRLHPVTIMLALLAGGTLAGIWGMLAAVPSTAVGKILVMHYYERHVLSGEADAQTGPNSTEEPAPDPETV